MLVGVERLAKRFDALDAVALEDREQLALGCLKARNQSFRRFVGPHRFRYRIERAS